MKVSKTLELNGGTVQFDGELSEAEVDMIIGIGLNYLLQRGALPFKVDSETDLAQLGITTETKQ